jgi:uncharacterized protein YoxC
MMAFPPKQKLAMLDEILKGDATTELPVVTKQTLIHAIRQHNKCLIVVREGCDMLVSNFEVISEQQEKVLTTVGALEDRLKRHEDLLDELDQRLRGTDAQVTQLWKQMDKVSMLEHQQKDQEAKIRDIQRWCQQLTKTREQEALESEERFITLQGNKVPPSFVPHKLNARCARRTRQVHLDNSRQAQSPVKGALYKL